MIRAIAVTLAGALVLSSGSEAVAQNGKYYIVFPTCANTPSLCATAEERAKAEAQLALDKQVAAERRALQDAEKARRDSEVKVFTDQYGAHRQAEAQRLQAMRAAAAAAKVSPVSPTKPADVSKCVNDPKASCAIER